MTTGPAVREFHGVAVPDPQAWLSDLESPRAKGWLADQNRRTTEFLAQTAELERCRKFLEANCPVLTQPWECVRGDRRFYLARKEGAAQPHVCMREGEGEERVLLDVNTTGKVLLIDYLAVSPNGRHIAFSLGKQGEYPSTMHVFDVERGLVTDSSLAQTVMPIYAWHPNGTGFYYSLMRRLFADDGSGDSRKDGLYWHALGSDWRGDHCVREYHDNVPGHLVFAIVPDGEHIVISTLHFSSGKSGASVAHLDEVFPRSDKPLRAVRLFDELEGFNQFLGAQNGELYFHTCRDAPMGRVVAITPARPLKQQWRTVIPQGKLALARPERFGGPMRGALSEQGLLLTYIEDAHSVLVHFELSGKQRARVELPLLSTVDAIEPIEDATGGFRVYTQSFLVPRAVYEYRDGKLTETGRVAVPDVDLSKYELKQVFYHSFDGTRVPMYLLHARGLPRSGNHPTLLYGYGGFNQSITPEFHPDAALWVELGGVFALANLRGGGEYGEAWHAAGSGMNKQNTFDDFYAAGEYLIAQGYTGAHKLCIRGLSNGGLLTAVAAHQRPDLFAAVITEVPLCDMFSLDFDTSGQSITAEYGSPAESRAAFDLLRSYSPMQNVKPYGPAQLVVAGERDSSARPEQIYKYVAERIEQLESDDQPVLLRSVEGEGHTTWRPENYRKTIAEEVAFLRHFVRPDAPGRVPDLRDVACRMRDGVHLSANVWLPRGLPGPFPAVLIRSPYTNDEKDFGRLGLQDYVNAGFAVVYQMVRGRGKSEGQFGFFFVEGKDGYDSVEWVANQDWCNGKVAMDGGSYLGTAQWLAAREHPPHLTCIMPFVPAGDWFNEVPYVGGALQVDFMFSWLGSMAGLEFDFAKTGDKNLEKYRPLIDAEKILGAELPFYKEILGHATFDEYWKRLQFTAADFLSISIPVLTVTGWFDGDQAGSLHYWRGIEEHSKLRDRAQLVIGPWQHTPSYLGGEPKLEEMDFGPGSVLPMRQIRLRFLRRHVLGQQLDWEPRVRVFVSGMNKWLASDRYPPAQVQVKPYYLAAEGRLTRLGAQGGVDRYAYDPLDPVHYKPAAKDHRELEQRPDVVVYSTEVLREPVTVVGPVEVVLIAASDQLDTDFTAKLLDVYPDGRVISLTHVGGILRARYRNGFEKPELLVRSQPYEFRIRLSHIGHTFLPGHRIRLHVSSSCFPLADPNTNTGGDFRTDTTTLTAAQTIFHDPQHPSRLLLPVLTESSPSPS